MELSVLAYSQDAVNVQGYTVWSLMDNMEFTLGYTQKYGLHYVNFSDPSRARTPKKSAQFYRDIILNNTRKAVSCKLQTYADIRRGTEHF